MKKFLRSITVAAQQAAPGERILAHGQSDTGRVTIGRALNSSNIIVSRESVEACLASTPAGIEITIINSACYSGLLAVLFPKVNGEATVLAPSTPEIKAWSSLMSASNSFRGGSLAAAVADEFALSAVSLPDPAASPLARKLLDADLGNYQASVSGVDAAIILVLRLQIFWPIHTIEGV
jgi:hypothetical protein